MKKTLGETLRKMRMERGITLAKLAQDTNKSPAFLSKIETGNGHSGNVSIITLRQLCDSLGITLTAFSKEMENNEFDDSVTDNDFLT